MRIESEGHGNGEEVKPADVHDATVVGAEPARTSTAIPNFRSGIWDPTPNPLACDGTHQRRVCTSGAAVGVLMLGRHQGEAKALCCGTGCGASKRCIGGRGGRSSRLEFGIGSSFRIPHSNATYPQQMLLCQALGSHHAIRYGTGGILITAKWGGQRGGVEGQHLNCSPWECLPDPSFRGWSCAPA